MALIMLCLPVFGQMTAEDWFNKGSGLMNQSRSDEAIRAFDKATEINRQYVEGWAGKGWALYGSSRYNEALQAYNKAIELNPNYVDAWVGKEFVLIELGYPDWLYPDPFFTSFDHAVSLDPNYGLAWIGAASRFAYNTDLGTYMEIVDNAIRLNPTYATEILSETLRTQAFRRMVFLKEGYPRPSKVISSNVTAVRRIMPAERFAKLNEIKKNG